MIRFYYEKKMQKKSEYAIGQYVVFGLEAVALLGNEVLNFFNISKLKDVRKIIVRFD